jgi:hypothetical protein
MQLLNACFKNRMLLKVIMRVPGARVDPDINPDRVGYYAPIKRCIYCGKSGLTIKLTDEHILAYALGGDAILPEASCIECAKITNEVETYCANYIFRAVRVLHRTHRRKRNRQSISGPRPMATSRQRAGLLILPSFDPPGIVLGRAASDSFSGTMIHTWQITRDRRAQGWRGVPASFGSDMNLITFGRMIAKVAHCTAVAHYGIGSFRPWLQQSLMAQAFRFLWVARLNGFPTQSALKPGQDQKSGEFQGAGASNTLLFSSGYTLTLEPRHIRQ